MSLPVTTWRIIIASWKHFARNIWLGLTTVFVLTLALLSVNVLVGVNTILTRAVQTLEDKIDISVYFKTNTPQAILDQAKFFLTSLPQVKTADLLTAADALAKFKKLHENEPKILGALGELEQNPLGATLVVQAKTTGDYPFLMQALQNPQFDFAIESVNFEDHADTIARVRDLSQSVRFFGIGLIAVFTLFSILIVFNTIRIAIYTQREEIGIMRLVGASSAYVRLPFVLEGVILALAAIVATAGLVFVAATYAEPRLRSFFDGADPGLLSYFIHNAPQLVTVETGVLAAIVALSSWAAVGKYLKR